MNARLPLLVLLALSTAGLAAPEKPAAPAPQRRMRPPDFPVDAAKRAALVQGIFDELRAKYVFPERLDAASAELKQRWGTPGFASLDHAHALVDRINEDLHDVFHDGHLRLMLAAALPPGMLGGDPDKVDPEQDKQQKAFERSIHYGVVRAEILPGNIGYLELSGFASLGPGQTQAYADAMGFVRETDSLIVDVRQNGGGDGDSVGQLVAYFLERPALLQTELFRTSGKPRAHEHFSAASVPGPKYGTSRDVFVLTAKRTFSAAEEFAYDLQTQKRAIIVGESTGGGANHNRMERVADVFALSIPYGTVKNAVTGTNWEGVGVRPDVAASAADALQVAQRLALEKQLAKEPDPDRRPRLQRRLDELK